MSEVRIARQMALGRTHVYLIWTPAAAAGDPFETAERALTSERIHMVQLRMKTAQPDERRRAGHRLRAICAKYEALFLVNDDIELARELEADGVHLGQDDASPQEAREALGPDVLIGLSTHGPTEILAAAHDPVDYLGLGPCYPTQSKVLTHPPGGPRLVRASMALCAMRRTFAIGGITVARAAELAAAGAQAVAVGAGILSAEDPAEAAEAIHRALAKVR